MLRSVTATRYVAPLREGGSLPGLLEADDCGTYVVKFRAAGQGRKALVAEVVSGALGRRLGLPVPELVVVDLDPELGKAEPDQEVQDLLKASGGPNLGMDFLPGALGFEPLAWRDPDAELAARVLWFDALVSTADRSWRNPNLLLWHRQLWLIDHGATLWFHHGWPPLPAPAADGGELADSDVRESVRRAAERPYDDSDHVLAPFANDAARRLAAVELAPRVTPELVADVLDQVPEDWLLGESHGIAGDAQSAFALSDGGTAAVDFEPGPGGDSAPALRAVRRRYQKYFAARVDHLRRAWGTA
ncbi:MAG: HipA family kinase [Actinomycetes bacterium]